MDMQKKLMKHSVVLLFSAVTLMSCGNEQHEDKSDLLSVDLGTNINIWPELDIEVKKDAEIEQKITSMLSRMTIEQKIAQMIQPEIRDIGGSGTGGFPASLRAHRRRGQHGGSQGRLRLTQKPHILAGLTPTDHRALLQAFAPCPDRFRGMIWTR